MADKSKRARVRKIVDLDVREISLVDNPANGIPTLLYKRAAPGAMPAELAKYAPATVTAGPGVEYDSESVMKLLGLL